MKPQRDSILLVDDDSDVLEALADELSEFYDVTALLSAQQALALLQGQAFAAIVSDVRMPGIDGLTLIRECAVRYPEMVRVLLTAFDDEEVQETALSEYGAYKLAKPWGDDLIVTLQNALKQRRSNIDLQRSIDLGNAAVDLDLRLHLNLKVDQVLPTIVSEILRVPEVQCLSVYKIDSDGKPMEPIEFGSPTANGFPSLTTRRVSPPEPDGDFFNYTVTIGQWPQPYAACVCQLSKVNDTTIRYLDYVGRQGYRTLLIVDRDARKDHEELHAPASNPCDKQHTDQPETMVAVDWIEKQLSVPSTVIVSAAESLRLLEQEVKEETVQEELKEIASDLDSAYTGCTSILERVKTQN